MICECRYCRDGYRLDAQGFHWVVTSLQRPTVKLIQCLAKSAIKDADEAAFNDPRTAAEMGIK